MTYYKIFFKLSTQPEPGLFNTSYLGVWNYIFQVKGLLHTYMNTYIKIQWAPDVVLIKISFKMGHNRFAWLHIPEHMSMQMFHFKNADWLTCVKPPGCPRSHISHTFVECMASIGSWYTGSHLTHTGLTTMQLSHTHLSKNKTKFVWSEHKPCPPRKNLLLDLKHSTFIKHSI